MLRGLVICPDEEMAAKLDAALADAGRVGVVREIDRYPSSIELMRFVRAHAPQVVFLSAESLPKLIEVVDTLEREAPGLQLIAVHKSCDPSVLLDVMRAGIREFLSLPFSREALFQSLARVEEQLQKRPVAIDSTEYLFSFLPAKQGVGASTVAMNAAVAVARGEGNGTLLIDLDLNSGILGFMLKLSSFHSVLEAAENAHALDESLWPQLVSRIGNLDVLHSGRLNTDFRIESAQLRHIFDFARRQYRAICVDLSGNLERYSLEVMHESKRIFLVCTPEIPAIHLAREKLNFLVNLDLGDRVSVLLNRSQKRAPISAQQIEELLGVPIAMSFPNDYQGVHRSLQAGRAVDPATELGKQFANLARAMLDRRVITQERTKRFVDYFSILPGKYTLAADKK